MVFENGLISLFYMCCQRHILKYILPTLSNSELIKHRFESQFYSLPWTNRLTPQNFCILSHIMLIGMVWILRVVMRIKWYIMLLHIKYLIKWYFYRVTTHIQEMLLNIDFLFQLFSIYFTNQSKKFSLQICILSDLEDCTVAWNIQLHSLEPQAVPKARRMYFFRTCDNREQWCCTSN